MKKNILKEYFTFTRKERIAVIVIAVLISGIWLVPAMIKSDTNEIVVKDSNQVEEVKKLSEEKQKEKQSEEREVYEKRPKQIYINHYNNYAPKKQRVLTVIDINTADTSAFIALPGIGSKLASRIVNFRDRLGGFYSIEQVGEVYGIADSVFQKIKPYLKLENIAIKKININTATIDELKIHPYIRYQLAKVIVAYRAQHGRFEKPEDLKNITILTEDVFKKIVHYLLLE